MNETLLAKFMAFLPKVETGATEAIELAQEVRTAAQAASVWTNEHEAAFQNSPAAAVQSPGSTVQNSEAQKGTP